MLDHPTHDQLRALKLDGMADAFTELQTRDDAADLNHAEWLGLLIDREATSRSTKKFQSRMRGARLRHVGAAIEDVDFVRRLKKLGRARGLRFGTLWRAPITTSCRKFDQFGDWFLVRNPRFLRRVFTGKDRQAADSFWYDPRR